MRNYKDKPGFRYDVLIINNTTLSKEVIKNLTDFKVPIFSVNQSIFEDLMKLDIRNEVGNYITHIKYIPITTDSLTTFTSVTSFVLTGVLSYINTMS